MFMDMDPRGWAMLFFQFNFRSYKMERFDHGVFIGIRLSLFIMIPERQMLRSEIQTLKAEYLNCLKGGKLHWCFAIIGNARPG